MKWYGLHQKFLFHTILKMYLNEEVSDTYSAIYDQI